MEEKDMSRKNRSPEEKARKAKIRELLQMANIPSMVTIMEISVYLEIRSVYKELHADHETGAADNK